MALRFLLDEHLRGPLWQAIQQHNSRGGMPIDALRVGDPVDLPLGSLDPAILVWAEREGRLILTEDKRTMPGHFQQHLQAGRHSPGVIILRLGFSASRIVGALELVAHAGFAADFEDQVTFAP